MQARPTLGRVVILTGAAGGIGSATMNALLAEGHSVAAVDRDTTRLRQLSETCTDPEVAERFQAIVADLESEGICAILRFGVEGSVSVHMLCVGS